MGLITHFFINWNSYLILLPIPYCYLKIRLQLIIIKKFGNVLPQYIKAFYTVEYYKPDLVGVFLRKM